MRPTKNFKKGWMILGSNGLNVIYFVAHGGKFFPSLMLLNLGSPPYANKINEK